MSLSQVVGNQWAASGRREDEAIRIFGLRLMRLERPDEILGERQRSARLRVKGRTRQIKRDDWPIVLLDAHPGYISYEQFRRHQQQLDDNRTWRPEEWRGAVREGAALLQGIILC